MLKSNHNTDLIFGKVPPQAIEMEGAVLGAIMVEKEAFERTSQYLSDQSFYSSANQLVYKACKQLHENGQQIDLLTVVETLKSNDDLEKVGGAYYVTRLTNAVVSAANIEQHAHIIQLKYIQREVIRICGEILSEAYNDAAHPMKLVEKIQEKVFKISSGLYTSQYKSIAEVLPKMLQEIDRVMSKKTEITGVPSGFKSLDANTLGFQPGDLIILAARPSVGKTAFMLNIAHNTSMMEHGTNVGLFSLEMGDIKLSMRLAAMHGKLPLYAIKKGTAEMKEIVKTANSLSKLGIYIDDCYELTLAAFRAKARRMVSKHKIGLIIVDYLQLMKGKTDKSGNREQEISGLSRGLKAAAKELNVPIIALSQLSREVEKRTNRVPQLSDLRESGAIEQDADIVMFLWRPSEFEVQENPQLNGKAMLKIAKFRDGELNDYLFEADDNIQKWSEISSINNRWKPVNSVDFSEARKM